MTRALMLGLIVATSLAACVSTQEYDTSRAWSACGEIDDKAERDACMERALADYAAERQAFAEDISHDTAVRERRAAELEALGVPQSERATGPVVPK